MNDLRGLPVPRIGVIDDDGIWPFLAHLFDQQLPLCPVPIQTLAAFHLSPDSLSVVSPNSASSSQGQSHGSSQTTPAVSGSLNQKTTAPTSGREAPYHPLTPQPAQQLQQQLVSSSGPHATLFRGSVYDDYLDKLYAFRHQPRLTELAALVRPLGFPSTSPRLKQPSLLPFRHAAAATLVARLRLLLTYSDVVQDVEASSSLIVPSGGSSHHSEAILRAFRAIQEEDWASSPPSLASAQLLLGYGAQLHRALTELLSLCRTLDRCIVLASQDTQGRIRQRVRNKVQSYLQTIVPGAGPPPPLPKSLQWLDEPQTATSSGSMDGTAPTTAIDALVPLSCSPTLQLWSELLPAPALAAFLLPVRRTLQISTPAVTALEKLRVPAEAGTAVASLGAAEWSPSQMNQLSAILQRLVFCLYHTSDADVKSGFSYTLRHESVGTDFDTYRVLSNWQGAENEGAMPYLLSPAPLGTTTPLVSSFPHFAKSFAGRNSSTGIDTHYLPPLLPPGTDASDTNASVASLSSDSAAFQTSIPTDSPIWLEPVVVDSNAVVHLANQFAQSGSTAGSASSMASHPPHVPTEPKLPNFIDLLNPRYRLVQHLREVPLALMQLVTCPDPEGYKELKHKVRSVHDAVSKLVEREQRLALQYARTLPSSQAKVITNAVNHLAAGGAAGGSAPGSGHMDETTAAATAVAITAAAAAAATTLSSSPGEASNLVCPVPLDLVIVYVSLGHRTPQEYVQAKNSIRDGLSAFFSFVSPVPSPTASNSSNASTLTQQTLSSTTNASGPDVVTSKSRFATIHRYEPSVLSKLDKHDRRMIQRLQSDFPKATILRLDPWSGKLEVNIPRHSSPNYTDPSSDVVSSLITEDNEADPSEGVDSVSTVSSGFSHWRKLVEHLQSMLANAFARRWRLFVTAQQHALLHHRLPGWNIAQFIEVHEGLALLEAQSGNYLSAAGRYNEIEGLMSDPHIASSYEICRSDFDTAIDIDIIALPKYFPAIAQGSRVGSFDTARLKIWARPVPYPALFPLPCVTRSLSSTTTTWGRPLSPPGEHETRLRNNAQAQATKEYRSLLVPELGLPERPLLSLDLDLYLVELIARVRRHREEAKRALLHPLITSHQALSPSDSGESVPVAQTTEASPDMSIDMTDPDMIRATAAALASAEVSVPAGLSTWAAPLLPLSPLMQLDAYHYKEGAGPTRLELQRSLFARQSRLLLFFAHQPLVFLERALSFLGKVAVEMRQGEALARSLVQQRVGCMRNEQELQSAASSVRRSSLPASLWRCRSVEAVCRVLDLDDTSVNIADGLRWWESPENILAWREPQEMKPAKDDSTVASDTFDAETKANLQSETGSSADFASLERDIAQIMATGVIPLASTRISALARAPRAATAWLIGAVLDALRIAEDCLSQQHQAEMADAVEKAAQAANEQLSRLSTDDVARPSNSQEDDSAKSPTVEQLRAAAHSSSIPSTKFSEYVKRAVAKARAAQNFSYSLSPAPLPALDLSETKGLPQPSKPLAEMRALFDPLRKPQLDFTRKYGLIDNDETNVGAFLSHSLTSESDFLSQPATISSTHEHPADGNATNTPTATPQKPRSHSRSAMPTPLSSSLLPDSVVTPVPPLQLGRSPGPWLESHPIAEVADVTWQELNHDASPKEYASMMAKRVRHAVGEESTLGDSPVEAALTDARARLRAKHECELRRLTELRASALSLVLTSLLLLAKRHGFPSPILLSQLHSAEDASTPLMELLQAHTAKEALAARALSAALDDPLDFYTWDSAFTSVLRPGASGASGSNCSMYNLEQCVGSKDTTQCDNALPYHLGHIIAPATLEETGFMDEVFNDQTVKSAPLSSVHPLSASGSRSPPTDMSSAGHMTTSPGGSSPTTMVPNLPKQDEVSDATLTSAYEDEETLQGMLGDPSVFDNDISDDEASDEMSSDDEAWQANSEHDGSDALSDDTFEQNALYPIVLPVLDLPSIWQLDLALPLEKAQRQAHAQEHHLTKIGARPVSVEHASDVQTRAGIDFFDNRKPLLSRLVYSQFASSVRGNRLVNAGGELNILDPSTKKEQTPTSGSMQGAPNPKLVTAVTSAIATAATSTRMVPSRSTGRRSIGAPPSIFPNDSDLTGAVGQEGATILVENSSEPIPMASSVPPLAMGRRRFARWRVPRLEFIAPGIVESAMEGSRYISERRTNAWGMVESAQRKARQLTQSRHPSSVMRSARRSRNRSARSNHRALGLGFGASTIRSVASRMYSGSPTSASSVLPDASSPSSFHGSSAPVTPTLTPAAPAPSPAQHRFAHLTRLSPPSIGVAKSPTDSSINSDGPLAVSRRHPSQSVSRHPMPSSQDDGKTSGQSLSIIYRAESYERRLLRLRHSLFFASSTLILVSAIVSRLRGAYERLGRSRSVAALNALLAILTVHENEAHALENTKIQQPLPVHHGRPPIVGTISRIPSQRLALSGPLALPTIKASTTILLANAIRALYPRTRSLSYSRSNESTQKGWPGLAVANLHAAAHSARVAKLLHQGEDQQTRPIYPFWDDELVILLQLLSSVEEDKHMRSLSYPQVPGSKVSKNTLSHLQHCPQALHEVSDTPRPSAPSPSPIIVSSHDLDIVEWEEVIQAQLDWCTRTSSVSTDSQDAESESRENFSRWPLNPAIHFARVSEILAQSSRAHLVPLTWLTIPLYGKIQHSIFRSDLSSPYTISTIVSGADTMHDHQAQTRAAFRALKWSIATKSPTVLSDTSSSISYNDLLQIAATLRTKHNYSREPLDVASKSIGHPTNVSQRHSCCAPLAQFSLDSFILLKSAIIRRSSSTLPVGMTATLHFQHQLPIPLLGRRLHAVFIPKSPPPSAHPSWDDDFIYVEYSKFGAHFRRRVPPKAFMLPALPPQSDGYTVSLQCHITTVREIMAYLIEGPVFESCSNDLTRRTNHGRTFAAYLKSLEEKVPASVFDNLRACSAEQLSAVARGLCVAVVAIANWLMGTQYLATRARHDPNFYVKVTKLMAENALDRALPMVNPSKVVGEYLQSIDPTISSVLDRICEMIKPSVDRDLPIVRFAQLENLVQFPSFRDSSTLNTAIVLMIFASKLSDHYVSEVRLVPTPILLPPPLLEFWTVHQTTASLPSIDSGTDYERGSVDLKHVSSHRLYLWSLIDQYFHPETATQGSWAKGATPWNGLSTTSTGDDKNSVAESLLPSILLPPPPAPARTSQSNPKQRMTVAPPPSNYAPTPSQLTSQSRTFNADDQASLSENVLSGRTLIGPRLLSLQLSRLSSQATSALLGFNEKNAEFLTDTTQELSFDGVHFGALGCAETADSCRMLQLLDCWVDLTDSLILRYVDPSRIPVTIESDSDLAASPVAPTVEVSLVDSQSSGNTTNVPISKLQPIPVKGTVGVTPTPIPDLWLPRADPLTVRVTVRAGDAELDAPYIRLESPSGLAVVSTSCSPRLVSTLKTQFTHVQRLGKSSNPRADIRLADALFMDSDINAYGVALSNSPADVTVATVSATLYHMPLLSSSMSADGGSPARPTFPSISASLRPIPVSIAYHPTLAAFIIPFTMPAHAILTFDLKLAVPGAMTATNPLRLLKRSSTVRFVTQNENESEADMIHPESTFYAPSAATDAQAGSTAKASHSGTPPTPTLMLPSLPAPHPPTWSEEWARNHGQNDLNADVFPVGFVHSMSSPVMQAKPRTEFVLADEELPKDLEGGTKAYLMPHLLRATLFTFTGSGPLVSMMLAKHAKLKLTLGSPIWTSTRVWQIGQRLLYNFTVHTLQLRERPRASGFQSVELTPQYCLFSVRLTAPRHYEVQEAGAPTNPIVALPLKEPENLDPLDGTSDNAAISEISVSRRSVSRSTRLFESSSFDSTNPASLLSDHTPLAGTPSASLARQRSYEHGLSIPPGGSSSFSFALAAAKSAKPGMDSPDPYLGVDADMSAMPNSTQRPAAIPPAAFGPTSLAFGSYTGFTATGSGEVATAMLRLQVGLIPQHSTQTAASLLLSNMLQCSQEFVSQSNSAENGSDAAVNTPDALIRSTLLRDPNLRVHMLAPLTYRFPIVSVAMLSRILPLTRPIRVPLQSAQTHSQTSAHFFKHNPSSLPFAAYIGAKRLAHNELLQLASERARVPRTVLLVSLVPLRGILKSLGESLHVCLSAGSCGSGCEGVRNSQQLRLLLHAKVISGLSPTASGQATLTQLSTRLASSNKSLSHEQSRAQPAFQSRSQLLPTQSPNHSQLEQRWCPCRFSFALSEAEWIVQPANLFSVMLLPPPELAPLMDTCPSPLAVASSEPAASESTDELSSEVSVHLTLTRRSSTGAATLPQVVVKVTPMTFDSAQQRWVDGPEDESTDLKPPLIRIRSYDPEDTVPANE